MHVFVKMSPILAIYGHPNELNFIPSKDPFSTSRVGFFQERHGTWIILQLPGVTFCFDINDTVSPTWEPRQCQLSVYHRIQPNLQDNSELHPLPVTCPNVLCILGKPLRAHRDDSESLCAIDEL